MSEDGDFYSDAESVEDVLREFGACSYWHGEDTGDYDLTFAFKEKFFEEAVKKIRELGEAGK